MLQGRAALFFCSAEFTADQAVWRKRTFKKVRVLMFFTPFPVTFCGFSCPIQQACIRKVNFRLNYD